MSRHVSTRLARHFSSRTAPSLLHFARPSTVSRQNAPISPRPIHTTSTLRSNSGLTNLFDAADNQGRPRIAVTKLNDEGFHLSDGLVIPGGVIFVDNRAFLWDVDPVGVDELSGRGKWGEEGWSRERFKVFEMVVPRPGERVCVLVFSKSDFRSVEILIFGTGKSALPPPPDIREYISRLGISLEVMDSVRSVFSSRNLYSADRSCA